MIGSDRYRTHTCVGAADANGATVRVAGWVHRRRDHGGLIFIDLRDRSGLIQLVFDPEAAPQAHSAAHRFHNEDVVSVDGTVAAREAKNVNLNIPTGGMELRVTGVEVLASADPLPFSVEDETQEAAKRSAWPTATSKPAVRVACGRWSFAPKSHGRPAACSRTRDFWRSRPRS